MAFAWDPKVKVGVLSFLFLILFFFGNKKKDTEKESVPVVRSSYPVLRAKSYHHPVNATTATKTTTTTSTTATPLREPEYMKKLPPKMRYTAKKCVDLLTPNRQLKYFKETGKGNHFDIRFYKRPYENEERVAVIKQILINWSEFAEKNHIVYWLAHGTLLGWYRTKKLIPWDDDLDFETTVHSLVTQMRVLNGTVWKDRFLLDVGAGVYNRQVDPSNQIDARFIDKKSGIYADFAAVSHCKGEDHTDEKRETRKISKIRDQMKKEREEKKGVEGNGIYHDKTPYIYGEGHLFPLTVAVLEGVNVWIPNNYTWILAQEYGPESLTEKAWNGYIFDEEKHLWVEDTESQKLMEEEDDDDALNFFVNNDEDEKEIDDEDEALHPYKLGSAFRG